MSKKKKTVKETTEISDQNVIDAFVSKLTEWYWVMTYTEFNNDAEATIEIDSVCNLLFKKHKNPSLENTNLNYFFIISQVKQAFTQILGINDYITNMSLERYFGDGLDYSLTVTVKLNKTSSFIDSTESDI